MFGLMRPEGGCSHKQSTDYRFHRMHYCGVCKAMGNSYGHKTRLLLNYDIVFLAELLSEIAAEDLNQWGGAYQAINQCFTMPKGQETPISLQYAADANLLLSELKVNDHIEDSGQLSWRFAGWWFNSAFAKATKALEKWGADPQEIQYWANIQAAREAETPDKAGSLSDYLWTVAEPTAQLTSMVFRLGAMAIGKAEQASAMAEIGRQFGYLAYVLDAFEDVEKDAQRRQFNPLLSYFEGYRTLAEAQFEQARTIIDAIQVDMRKAMSSLSLDPSRVEFYSTRLGSNVAMQIYKDRVLVLSFREHLQHRWQKAKKYAADISCDNHSWTAKLRYHLLSVAVFIAPRTPEYMGMSSKEMAIFTWAAFISAFLAAIGLGFAIGSSPVKKKRKARKKEKRSLKRFFRKLRSTFAGRNNCWEACAAACCTACCAACCESCCQAGCNSCCDSCCNGDDNAWIWLLIIFGILVIAVTVLLIILL